MYENSPDSHLWLAVIYRAIQDYVYPYECSDPTQEDYRNAKNAYRWLTSESDKPYSLRWCSLHLFSNPNYLSAYFKNGLLSGEDRSDTLPQQWHKRT